MVQVNDLSAEEQEIARLLISIICLYGNDGLPLEKVDEEYMMYVGTTVPYKKLGYTSLRSLVATLPEIYLVRDDDNNEVLIEQSTKSLHIKQLILKQKKQPVKRKNTVCDWAARQPSPKKLKINDRELPVGSFLHSSSNSISINQADRFLEFQQLESMLPLFYKHQALGDDFFLDIADSKLGYYVPDDGPKEIGLCCVGQTIAGLTAKVQASMHIAPRVVVMIGFEDLLQGTSVNKMISDLRNLIIELRNRHTRTTLMTLIPSPKFPQDQKLQTRMDIFNNAILDYAYETELSCNVIDMNAIFLQEAQAFQRDYGRLRKVAKKDPYKVFSDYGRKIFLATLKSCLREQIDIGH